MKFVELGKSKEKVSAIGLGTWQFGSKGWGYGRDFDKSTTLKLMNLAMDMGANLIDTAEIYSKGKSEKIIGEAIKGRREEVFIATKVSPFHLRYGSVLKAAKRSINRLGVKTIDLYQIHWPNPVINLKGTIKALDKLVDDGIIRYIGVSNFSKKLLKRAQSLTEHEIVSDQVNYSLARLDIEKKGLLSYAKQRGVKIIAYSPLAQGLLSGKYTPENRLKNKGVRRINKFYSPGNLKRALPLIDKLKELGEKYSKAPAQIALNWLISDDSVIVIPGAKSEDQLKFNLGAADFNLEKVELDELRNIAKKFHASRIKAIPWMIGLQR